GARRWISTTKMPVLDSQGGIHGVLGVFEDITERKQAAEALLESEERFRRLAAATWEGIIIHQEGAILDANQSAATITGYPVEEIIGNNILNFLAPESIKPAMQKLSDGVTQDQLYLELKIVKKDKTTVAVEALGRPIRYHHVDARVLAFRDITERKQAEDALRESELLLRSITHSARDAILMMDSVGKVSYWNPAAEHILGYTNGEAIGQNLHSLLAPPRYQAAHQAAFSEFVQTGQGAAVGKTLDLAARRKDGQEIFVQLSLSAIQIESDWHAVGILRDITESKRAREALQESEEQYRVLFQGSTLGMLITATDTMQFVSCNPSLCRMYGYSEEELLQLRIEDLHPKDSLARVLSEFESQVRDDKPVSFSIPCLRKDGTVFYADVSGANTVIQGRNCAVGFFTDVTDFKNVQSQLVQSSKLASIGELTSGVAHELNQPLMVIRGMAQLIERAARKGDIPAEALLTQLEPIDRNTKRMTRIINHLRTFSRQSQMEFAPVEINQVIEESFLMIGEQLKLRDIAVKRDLAPDLPTILGDGNQLEQVFLNLIANSQDALTESRERAAAGRKTPPAEIT
ncbi:MAG: PAS domain S-box protein, partial [Deltaproteobacteria bacterium]